MEVEDMCNLSQGIRNEARAEGLAKGRAEGLTEGAMKERILNVKNLMLSLSIDVDKALDLLNISEDLRPTVKEKLS